VDLAVSLKGEGLLPWEFVETDQAFQKLSATWNTLREKDRLMHPEKIKIVFCGCIPMRFRYWAVDHVAIFIQHHGKLIYLEKNGPTHWLEGDSILLVEYTMGHPVALAAILPGGTLFRLAEVADFELEFDEAVVAFTRQCIGGERGEYGAILLLRVGAIAEMAACCESYDFRKSLLRALPCGPNVEFPHARRVNDHATLG
jgi:hypothetical protein